MFLNTQVIKWIISNVYWIIYVFWKMFVFSILCAFMPNSVVFCNKVWRNGLSNYEDFGIKILLPKKNTVKSTKKHLLCLSICEKCPSFLLGGNPVVSYLSRFWQLSLTWVDCDFSRSNLFVAFLCFRVNTYSFNKSSLEMIQMILNHIYQLQHEISVQGLHWCRWYNINIPCLSICA